ncbi:hypothetical protein [Symbiopectobacterium sp. RP]|uniref:hypothetical protein n=1 Tax=Symbiopectobacterium sp. RP TaxID=3248553 RepID=UPI003D265740
MTDMLFLALQQDIANRLKNDYSQCPDMWQKIQLIVIKIMSLGYTGIGALSYDSGINFPKPSSENLGNLLKWDLKESAFSYLLNKYLLQTSVSGVQPKVMFSAESKGAVLYPNLIAKTGD